MSELQKIRIKLKAYDHALLDQSAAKIVETAKKTGADVSGPIPLPTEREKGGLLGGRILKEQFILQRTKEHPVNMPDAPLHMVRQYTQCTGTVRIIAPSPNKGKWALSLLDQLEFINQTDILISKTFPYPYKNLIRHPRKFHYDTYQLSP